MRPDRIPSIVLPPWRITARENESMPPQQKDTCVKSCKVGMHMVVSGQPLLDSQLISSFYTKALALTANTWGAIGHISMDILPLGTAVNWDSKQLWVNWDFEKFCVSTFFILHTCSPWSASACNWLWQVQCQCLQQTNHLNFCRLCAPHHSPPHLLDRRWQPLLFKFTRDCCEGLQSWNAYGVISSETPL